MKIKFDFVIILLSNPAYIGRKEDFGLGKKTAQRRSALCQMTQRGYDK
jgi:hypothetical protein